MLGGPYSVKADMCEVYRQSWMSYKSICQTVKWYGVEVDRMKTGSKCVNNKDKGIPHDYFENYSEIENFLSADVNPTEEEISDACNQLT